MTAYKVTCTYEGKEMEFTMLSHEDEQEARQSVIDRMCQAKGVVVRPVRNN